MHTRDKISRKILTSLHLISEANKSRGGFARTEFWSLRDGIAFESAPFGRLWDFGSFGADADCRYAVLVNERGLNVGASPDDELSLGTFWGVENLTADSECCHAVLSTDRGSNVRERGGEDSEELKWE